MVFAGTPRLYEVPKKDIVSLYRKAYAYSPDVTDRSMANWTMRELGR